MRFTTMKGAEILLASGTGMAGIGSPTGEPGDAVTATVTAGCGPDPPGGEAAIRHRGEAEFRAQ
jgi:hypothetical protein